MVLGLRMNTPGASDPVLACLGQGAYQMCGEGGRRHGADSGGERVCCLLEFAVLYRSLQLTQYAILQMRS